MDETVPIRNDDVIVLQGPSEYNPVALDAAVSPLGFQAFVTTRFDWVESEIKRLVCEHGVSYVWRLARLQEAVLPKGLAQRPALLAVLGEMLSSLAPSRELVVVDRYLLPSSAGTGYVADLVALLANAAKSAQRIVLVTGGYDANLLDQVRVALVSALPACLVEHRQSCTFHDRFWIGDRLRGVFVGASINGIGKRYSLVDIIAEEDVRDIVAILKSEGLL
jgi:hypothetical protein